MAEALVELIGVLSSKEGRITRQEAEILDGCKSQAIKGFAVGGSIATGLVWVATRKLNTFLRVNLAGGAALITGMWRSKESLDTSVNHILAMDGSRMQRELRKIVLEKYGSNPQRMQAFSNHFYLEEVFSDSTLERPKSVYRQRNLYMDVDRIANSDAYGVPDANKNEVYRQQRRPTSDIKQVRINPAFNMVGYGDPLEVLFGYSPTYEESHQPAESGVSAEVQSRSQRKADRRHRLRRRHRGSSSLEEL